MKRLSPVMLILASLCLVSCGGKPARQIPRHLSAGARQMEEGLGWYQKGCYRESLEYFFRAYELYSAADMLDGVAMSLNNIGTIYRATGKYEEALSSFDEAHAIYSELDDQEGAAKVLSNKAATYIRAGDYDRAQQTLEAAMGLLPTRLNPPLRISVLQNQGVLLTKQGSYDAAEEILTECLNQADALGPAGLASLHSAFGNLMLENGRPADAISAFEKALSIDRELGFYDGIAEDLFWMGQAHLKLGEEEKAVRHWQRGVKIFALTNQAEQVHKTMELLREAAHKAGIDISVTEAFVERWRQGRLYESPCRD